MKKNILITDTVKDIKLEKKILSEFNLSFKNINKIKNKEFIKFDGILTGHHITFNEKML